MGGFGTVAVRMDRLARGLDGKALQQLSEAAALVVKKEAERQLVRQVGGDKAISGYGRGRRRGSVTGGVGFDYEGQGTSLVKYRPPGYWVMLEEGSYKAGGQWKSPRRRGGGRRARGSIGTYTRAPVRPRRTVSKARDIAEPKVRDAVQDEFYDIVNNLMGG